MACSHICAQQLEMSCNDPSTCTFDLFVCTLLHVTNLVFELIMNESASPVSCSHLKPPEETHFISLLWSIVSPLVTKLDFMQLKVCEDAQLLGHVTKV